MCKTVLVPRLSNLLQLAPLGLRTVIAGTGDPAVRWVTTSELTDPSPYLDGSELLLTTGLVEQDWTRFVNRIAAAGVAGVGFGIGLSHDDVPTGLATAAHEAGLPVIAVPESTPFIAIGKALSRLITAEERTSTETALAVQQELTRVVSQRDGVNNVLAVLAQAAEGDAGVVDESGTALAPPDFQLRAAGRRAIDTLGRPQVGRSTVTETDEDGTTVVHPLGPAATGEFLVLRTPAPPGGAVRTALTTTVALLDLHAERARAESAAELRLRNCASRLILTGAVDAGSEVAALARSGSSPPPVIQVLRATDPEAGLREQLARYYPDTLTAADEDGTVAVLAAPTDTADIETRALAAGCHVGTGHQVVLADAGRGDDAARAALTATSARSPAIRWDEWFRADIRTVLSAETSRAVSTRILGPVVDDPVLLNTLRAYLEHLGRWQPTSTELGVHRNTLRKRVARIEHLTGRSVDAAANRADLWIAVEIQRETT